MINNHFLNCFRVDFILIKNKSFFDSIKNQLAQMLLINNLIYNKSIFALIYFIGKSKVTQRELNRITNTAFEWREGFSNMRK